MVDLPPPLGPTSATVSPGATRSEMSFTTGSFSPGNVKLTSTSLRSRSEFASLSSTGLSVVAL